MSKHPLATPGKSGVADGSYCEEIPVTTIQTPVCEHQWVEGVDDQARLVEPAYDICIQCGLIQR